MKFKWISVTDGSAPFSHITGEKSPTPKPHLVSLEKGGEKTFFYFQIQILLSQQPMEHKQHTQH